MNNKIMVLVSILSLSLLGNGKLNNIDLQQRRRPIDGDDASTTKHFNYNMQHKTSNNNRNYNESLQNNLNTNDLITLKQEQPQTNRSPNPLVALFQNQEGAAVAALKKWMMLAGSGDGDSDAGGGGGGGYEAVRVNRSVIKNSNNRNKRKAGILLHLNNYNNDKLGKYQYNHQENAESNNSNYHHYKYNRDNYNDYNDGDNYNKNNGYDYDENDEYDKDDDDDADAGNMDYVVVLVDDNDDNENNNIKQNDDNLHTKSKLNATIKQAAAATAKETEAATKETSEKFGQLPQNEMELQQQQQQQQEKQQQSKLEQEQPSFLPQEYHHLSDYRLLYNAERETKFLLYTVQHEHDKRHAENPLSKANSTSTTNNSIFSSTYSKFFNIFSGTITSAFIGPMLPVADNIQIEEIQLYNRQSLRQSKFNPFNPTRILIHGWLGGSNAGIYNVLVPEYLKHQHGTYNVITVDWGSGAMADYFTASYRVKPVGKTIAKFIDFLHVESGTPFENIHVIGFSMGAHVAGIAGKHIQTGRLPVIYALDPAMPFFRYDNIAERVDLTDADYVEVVHSSAGTYGFDRPLGHVDFYLNYGHQQPGCFFHECSHVRAFQVFAESLQNEVLTGVECEKSLWWEIVRNKRCSKETGYKLSMSVEGLNKTMRNLRRGIYYVRTAAHPPYTVN